MSSPPDPAALTCDVLVVGGGINGTGIARDLAGRGWRVELAEQDDLAAHTSSASTKLIHGGLRYLEHYEFGLVRRALQEREVLLRSAPHLMGPLGFVMPHDPQDPSLRPVWLVRLGLWLYDHLARREVLPGSRAVALAGTPLGEPLQPRFTTGFVYADGWVDDARLVVACALDAAAHGAQIHTRTACTAARPVDGRWQATLTHTNGCMQTVQARALVNAAGPWAAQVLHGVAGQPSRRHLRLVKGSHIVVPARFAHDHAYIFQNPDGRVLFAIPYQQRFTLIGTTDEEWTGDAREVTIADDEIAYLCTQASRFLAQAVTPDQVVWSYAGVRPLLDDEAGNPAAVTRDYRLERHRGDAPLLTVWGGKITTYRKLAEQAADQIGQLLGECRPAWTRGAPLPGGDLQAWIGAPQRPDTDFARFAAALAAQHPWLPAPLAQRWSRAYGSRVTELLSGATALADLGAEVAPGLYADELRFLQCTEWARDADDVLWRRSKLGLHLSATERQRVADWLSSNPVSPTQEL